MSRARRESQRRLYAKALSLLLPLAFSAGCGGAGAGGSLQPGTQPATQPDFTITVAPTAISVTAGSSQSVTFSSAAVNGFSSAISVQITGLPAGVSATPTSFTTNAPSSQNVTFSADATMRPSTASIAFSASSGSLTHNALLGVSILQANTASPLTRTKYLRTDAVTEYYAWLNTHWQTFHSPTSHLFVTDPVGNTVSVFDLAFQTKIASIPVPGAFGIDETPDQRTIYVGSLIGDVYSIDPVAMQVKQRYTSSQIGPYGFQALSALVLSDGRLALLGSQGGIPSVDGSTNIALWSPSTNSISIYGDSNIVGVPVSPLCSFGVHIFGFGLTADRNSVLLGDENALCELNISTGQLRSATLTGRANHIVLSPDGHYFAVTPLVNGDNFVALYDANTLNQISKFDVSGDTSSAANLVFSANSATLFVSGPSTVYAYDVLTGKQVGWLPNIIVQYAKGGFAVGPATNPNYQFMDPSGLLIGPLEEGLGFLDTTQMRGGPVGTTFTNAYLDPATGPVSGGAVAQWSVPATVTSQSLIYFGKKLVPSFSLSGNTLSVFTPPGNPGPADVYIFTPDHGMQIIPDGFSYGPTILEVTPDASTTDGGGAGVIYGYGFGRANGTGIMDPDLKVAIAGKPATIVGWNPDAYRLSSPPFLLQAIYYTVPPGALGAADVTVTTSSGTVTSSHAMTYLPSAKTYPLANAALAQGIYDPFRDLYYFTDANKIQVFSSTQGQWLPPITVPAPGTAQRLWGISLSPDGTKLAVADAEADVVYLINPANPSSVKSFPVLPPLTPQGILVDPAGVAIGNNGIVYLTTVVQGGTGFHNFYKLDTNTGSLTDFGIDGPGSGLNDLYLRAALTPDGSKAFFNNDGYVFGIDTATDKLFSASNGPGCCYGDYDLTLAPNQAQVEATSYFYDQNLNASSFFALNDREVLEISYVYGTKFSPDGTLLFQPSSAGIDVLDGRLGSLRARIALPFPLSTNYDAVVSNGKDNVLVLITGTNGGGIAILDLTSIPEPGPVTYSAMRNPSDVGLASAGSAAPLNTAATLTKDSLLRHRQMIPHVVNLPGKLPR